MCDFIKVGQSFQDNSAMKKNWVCFSRLTHIPDINVDESGLNWSCQASNYFDFVLYWAKTRLKKTELISRKLDI